MPPYTWSFYQKAHYRLSLILWQRKHKGSSVHLRPYASACEILPRASALDNDTAQRQSTLCARFIHSWPTSGEVLLTSESPLGISRISAVSWYGGTTRVIQSVCVDLYPHKDQQEPVFPPSDAL